MVESDRIVFPNGIQQIYRINFPNGEALRDSERLKCSSCSGEMIAGKLFDQHFDWASKGLNYVCEPASIADFLHRECPLCGKICRIHKKSAMDNSGGDNMPNAQDVMKLYLQGDEIAELAKAGEVVATFVGPGEITEFEDKVKKNPDGTPLKTKRIQVCVALSTEEERFWSPNSTTMRKIIAKLGQNTEDWEGHKVKLEAVKQNVSGNMKLVIYGEPRD